MRGEVKAAPWIVLSGLLAAACGPTETARVPALETAVAEASTPRVLAELRAHDVPLTVQVVGVRRLSETSLRVDYVLARDPLAAEVEAARAQEAVDALVAALAGASVVSLDGQRRLFPLADAAGRPVGTAAESPEPGGRRTAWFVFAGHPPSGGPITLVLPGFPPARGIPVS